MQCAQRKAGTRFDVHFRVSRKPTAIESAAILGGFAFSFAKAADFAATASHAIQRSAAAVMPS
jgi:hypothetical protein